MLSQRNSEMDKNLKVGETLDEKNERIQQLEKDLARRTDEVALRKEVIESMSSSLMKHEKDNAEMASKLTLMKNQIMEHQIGSGLNKKYAAVKQGSKQIPVAVIFQKHHLYRLNLLSIRVNSST